MIRSIFFFFEDIFAFDFCNMKNMNLVKARDDKRLPEKPCSSSLTPLRSKLGDLAVFFQRKLRNGDLLRLRSLRLNVLDSDPIPVFGAL